MTNFPAIVHPFLTGNTVGTNDITSLTPRVFQSSGPKPERHSPKPGTAARASPRPLLLVLVGLRRLEHSVFETKEDKGPKSLDDKEDEDAN